MSLGQKLVLFALSVALIPVAAIGFSLVRLGEGALRTRIQEHQLTAAVAVAAKVSQAVESMAQHVAMLVDRFDVTHLSDEEREGLQRLVYRQSADVTAVMLVSPKGEALGEPLFRRSSDAELAEHLAMNAEAVALFRANLPRATPRRAGTVLMSPVYFPPQGAARVAILIPCGEATPEGTAGLGLEIALRDDVLRLEGVDTGPESSVFVVDRDGRVILHPGLPVGSTLLDHGAVAAFREGQGRGALRMRFREAIYAAAFASVGRLGWAVVVEQPESAAFATAVSMRRQIVGWISATTLVVLVLGLLFATRLRRALEALMAGARAFGSGDLSYRVRQRRGDEVGALAGTLNAMAAQLLSSREALEEWSHTLERRVEERTEELKQAQAQLLTQSKLAAIGQLGAGVAHEVNNPLAGILGYTQILLRKHPEADADHATLKKIEDAAKRCKAITANLLRFSERGLVGRTDTQINDVVREVLDAFRGPMEDAHIEVIEQCDAALPTISANSGQIALVLINLLSNAKNAMPQGGRATIATAPSSDGVTLTVADTGIGIAPEHLPRIFEPFFTTKTVWTGVGLGLSVAYRVVVDHGGRIDVQSEVGQGTTMTVSLPRTPPASSDLDGAGPQAVLLE